MASAAIASEIYAEQLRVLFRQIPIALAVNVINAAVTSAVLAAVVPGLGLMVWFGLVVLATCLRYAICVLYRRTDRLDRSPHVWDQLAVLGSAVSGSLWGFGAALMFPPDAVYQIFLGFTVGGMCAGAVVVHSSHFPTLLSFLLPASLPIAIRFMLEGTTPDFALAGMMILFAGALSVAGYNFNRSLVETYRLRFDLARQAQELESANARLIEETRVRRAAQDALRQAEKMDALGRLTGGLAHDFNNLLTVILGGLELLGPHISGERGRRLLATASDGAERGAKLTHSLLSFARQQQLDPEPVDANAVIVDFEPLLRRAIGENATLKLSLSPELAVCRIDPTHFQTTLLNLVLNAYDALPPIGGSIWIATENVTVNEREAALGSTLVPGSYVSVSVSDTGVGMTPEVVARAFEPFFTTKEVGKGSGLGLSQVYGFVTQSGGTVTIASAPMEGTTVRILLPALGEGARAQRADVATSESGDNGGGATTILVVEDDADLLSIVAEDLTELGYRVLTASDGPTALACLGKGRRIDLLFSDMVMPNGIRGDELARRAVALHPKLKVLLTSGYSDPGADRQFPFIPKPFRRHDLADALRGTLRR